MSEADETEFDGWLRRRFADIGPFTVLIVLVRIGDTALDLLRSTHLHVIGDETGWRELSGLFESAKVAWDGAVFFPAGPDHDALVADPDARAALARTVERLADNRLVLNEGFFFDRRGRQLHVEEVGSTH